MTEAELTQYVRDLKATYDRAYRELVLRRAIADIHKIISAVECYGDPDAG
jgi:hypothetical protein